MAAFAEARKRYRPGPARRRTEQRAKHRRRVRRAKPGTQLGLELVVRAVGGKRRGAGRRREGRLGSVPHRCRQAVRCTDAIHVTWRMRAHVWNLRSRRCFSVLLAALEAACERFGARLIAYSVQGNHLHMVWEAESQAALARAMTGLGTRIARGLNRVMGAKGRVLESRYHAVPLRSATQVRNVLRYLLDNARRHAAQAGRRADGVFRDAFTSLGKLDLGRFSPWRDRALGPPVGAEPRTDLLRLRWQHAAAVRLREDELAEWMQRVARDR